MVLPPSLKVVLLNVFLANLMISGSRDEVVNKLFKKAFKYRLYENMTLSKGDLLVNILFLTCYSQSIYHLSHSVVVVKNV